MVEENKKNVTSIPNDIKKELYLNQIKSTSIWKESLNRNSVFHFFQFSLSVLLMTEA